MARRCPLTIWRKISTLRGMEIEQAKLYFVPSCGEFLKVQPGTGDNLSTEDVAAGFTDYVIWNRFCAECLDIDGELPMECVNSGMVLDSRLRGNVEAVNSSVLEKVLEFAYGSPVPVCIFLQKF